MIEEIVKYRIAYRLKVTGQIIGYSEEYDTLYIANKMWKNGSQPTKEVETFIIKETIKREEING